MFTGAKKDLEVTDLYDVLPGANSEELELKLQKQVIFKITPLRLLYLDNSWLRPLNFVSLGSFFREWDKQVAKFKKDETKKKKGKPSLTKAIILAFGLKFILMGVFNFVEECLFR